MTTGEIIATRIDPLSTFLQRTVGLLSRSSVRPDEGVWIAPCRAIHTLGMRIPIDVIFLNRKSCVVRVVSNVRPNHLMLSCREAETVIELGTNPLHEIEVLPGDRLELIS